MGLKKRLKQIIEQNATPTGRRFDHLVTTMIILSILSFSVETLPNLPNGLRVGLLFLEWFLVAFFTVEYLARLWVADKAWRYLTSFWGVIDLLAILPFYLTLGFDLKTLRVIRLIRLLKLARYSKAIQRINKALFLAKEEAVLFLVMTLITLYLSAVGIYHFEHKAQPETFSSIFHSLWWAVTTLTTVGYGDTYPVTTGGRIFTFIVLMIGLGIVAVPAGLVSSALAKARQLEEDQP